MDEDQIADINFWQFSINGEFVIVFAQTAGNIINMVTRFVFLTHDSNVVIRSIYCRAHQISCAGIKADIFFVSMFFMDGFGHKSTIRSHHEAAHFCHNRYITHTSRHKHFFKCLAYTLANSKYVVALLRRSVRNTNTAGEVDEFNAGTGFVLQVNRELEKNFCKARIVLVGHGIAGKESVNTKMFNAFSHQLFIAFHHLFTGKTIFSIARIIHNIVFNREMTTRIKTAADSCWNVCNLLKKINMGNIVKVDCYIQLARQPEVFCRRHIGRKHNFAFFETNSVSHQKLCIRGAVSAAAFFAQNLQ